MAALWTPLDEPPLPAGERLASPFDELGPAPLARRAALHLQQCFRSGFLAPGFPASLVEEPGGGKMFGVLVVEAKDGRLGYLRAFSGTLDGRFDVPGYAPALFDESARREIEPAGERVVKALTARARGFAASERVTGARRALAEVLERHRREQQQMRSRHALSKAERREKRGQASVEEAADLDRRSRADKAERRRLLATQDAERQGVDAELLRVEKRLAAHERLHRAVSRRLMRLIHETYRVTNARGEVCSLRDLYAPAEPPGGAGDCAAPKLFALAFAEGLRPLALAEFWWGAQPSGGGRLAGEFYPACRDKCGPLLPFLLESLEVAPPRRFRIPADKGVELRIVHEDRWIVVVDKPPGLLSVPGRSQDATGSVLEKLRDLYPDAAGPLLVHRLDLDTSGLLVAARDPASHACLQKQFLRRRVEKRYVAILDGEVKGEAGVLELALRGDPHDRPRQIHDPLEGRSACTQWRVVERTATGPRPALPEGTGGVTGSESVQESTSVLTRVEFFPRSGRTHQLRVHAAHPLGLGCPIVGDRLYGRGGARLLLHAAGLAFVHPVTGARVSFESPVPF